MIDAAGHILIAQIGQQNAQTIAQPINPLNVRPIVAGVSATALGALQMLNAGVSPQLVYVDPLSRIR